MGVGLVEYALRVHTQPLDYWGLRPALNERIKHLVEQRQLTAPLPQMQLHADQNMSLTRDESRAELYQEREGGGS